MTVLPGPSAVTAALAVSGLPSDRFCFEGFPPGRPARSRAQARGASRRAADDGLLRVAPAAPGDPEADGQRVRGDRPAAVCRELTKTHEEVKRGSLGELAEWAADGVLGEITVVVGGGAPVAGAATAAAATTDDIAAKVAAAEQAGLTRKEAMASVAAETGLRRREVYDAVITARLALDHDPGRLSAYLLRNAQDHGVRVAGSVTRRAARALR